MALRKLYSLFFLVILSFTAKTQSIDTAFKNEWLGIDTLIVGHGLTKTALDKVNILYKKARQRQLQGQVIKCLLYQYSLQERITAQDPNPVLKNMEKELSASNNSLQKAVLHSLLATLYKQYFENHRWSIYNRKKTNGIPKEDITTWGMDDFTSAITQHYQLSLSNPELLKQSRIETYQAVVLKGNMPGQASLFDLLAHEALNYFKTGEAGMSKPIDAFILDDTASLGTTDQFIKARFKTKDSSSQAWISLQLFKELLLAHQNDTDKNIFIENNLERIEWVYGETNFSQKEILYKKALEEITQMNRGNATIAQAWYLLAKTASDNAEKYSPFADTLNRYGYVQRIADEALLLYKEDNRGVINLKNLLLEISRKELRTKTESVNIPGKAFRVLVSYRNIDTVFFRVIRLENGQDIRNRTGDRDFWEKVIAYQPYQTFEQVLPATHDHQLHAVEIKLESLPIGEYALISSSGKSFTEQKDKLCVQSFFISNMSYIQNGGDIFVLNRETGKPIANVKVAIYQKIYESSERKFTYENLANKITDEHGFIKIETKQNAYNFRFVFFKGNDRLDIKNTQLISYENDQPDPLNEKAAEFEKNNSRVFLFTDRSIYRPGQPVSFKGIAVTRDFNTKLSKLISRKDSSRVYLIDVNGKKTDSLKIVLNEYGSFYGSFRLPQNGVTGRYSISVPAITYQVSGATISVEEYKRPSFDVSFETPKGSYRLNEMITLTGTTLSYAGNPIDGAKVSYTVKRNTRLSEPLYWRRPVPSGNQREISRGEIKTDATGKFSISFKALTDDIIDQSANPNFDFSITADVTDINGETRSGQTSVIIGVSSLLLDILVPSLAETDSLKKIYISTTNLSYEKEPAKVQLKIYALQIPEHPVRKRYWERPDQFVMNKNEFNRYFPTDEYEEESNMRTWPVAQMVQDAVINTKDADTLPIIQGLLKAGYYKIEATAFDKYGVEVRSIQYTQLFDRNMKASVNPFYYTVNGTANPGETASFISGSIANHVYLIRKTESPKQKQNNYSFIERNKGIETINYSPDETERGGVNISEVFVIDNRAYVHQYMINVPWNNKQLQVTYASYRDKTEPGSNEKWTVTVQTEKKEAAPAELLTGMYDASLDQFQSHLWNIPSVWQNRYPMTHFSGFGNFTIETAIENDISETPHEEQTVTYDQLAAFASDLWNRNLTKWINDSTLHIQISLKRSLQSMNEPVTVGSGIKRESMLYDTRLQLKGNTPKDQNKAMSGSISGNLPPPAMPLEKFTAPYTQSAIDTVLSQTGMLTAIPNTYRKNFAETAFFFPQLYADSSGKYSFHFTMPEALTQWKWMSIAHTKDLAFGSYSANIITQKKLMIQPNAPRFLREGDVMEFSAKIVNLSDKEITGQVSFELVDAATKTSIDGWFQNVFPSQYFTVDAGKSFPLKFPIQVPYSFNQPLAWRIIAKAGEYSDGEENSLPVLTNRVLVTESLPLFLQNDTTQAFKFDKLIHTESESLSNESITVEYTTNPVWYAVQALPYLMEYPYECAEQTFNRFYANSLASFIVNKDPKIKQVFEQWKADSVSLQSNLQKNEELKQVLLQETPWVMEAESEDQQKKNIVLLFDMTRLSSQTESLIEKLSALQLPDGSFSWFKGGQPDRYMTHYILTGIGKLKKLGALSPEIILRLRNILVNAIQYSDREIAVDYHGLSKNKADLNKQQISGTQIDYLYMRSFFRDIAQQSPKAYDFYYQQGKRFWMKQNSYDRAKLGLVCFRNRDEKFATGLILPALQENSINNPKLGMYWIATYAGHWYQSPIEYQSMMIAFMSEINHNESLTKSIHAMKTWLLLNKQTSNWKTTVATADACYALLLNGKDWLPAERKITIQLGAYTIHSNNEKTTAGTGYFKKRIEGKQVIPEMGNITVTTNSPVSQFTHYNVSQSPSWGSVYWQYFEDMDKVTAAASPLSIYKKLFIEKNTDKGKVLEPVKEGDELKTGDQVVIRLELRSDRDMDYLHVKDMRASSMEPVNVLSSYKWQDGLGYYESIRDASTHFFIGHLPKGTYVFEYPVLITHTGLFSVGLATIQCMYAPEFISHSEGIKIRVAESVR